MNFAISNIAWQPQLDTEVAKLMHSYHINGLEAAPKKFCQDPLNPDDIEIEKFRTFWELHDIQIISMQALLFGLPYSAIFEGKDLQNNMISYLESIYSIASKIGAKKLVFGSPNNRKKGSLSHEQALYTGTEFFHRAAQKASLYNVILCIEPNPQEYGADFINTADEAYELIQRVDHPNFGLHLDLGGMTMAGENPYETIIRYGHIIKHFHVSEKNLLPIGSGTVDHEACGKALKKIGYKNWVSLEMREAPEPLKAIEETFSVINKSYRTE